jgi:bacterioferritin
MPKRKSNVTAGVLADKQKKQREQIIAMLTKAYWMEIETVMSYIANSVNPDGLRAREVVEALETDIQEELGHAQRFAARIKELYGTVPGSMEFKAEQKFLQPPKTSTDIVTIVKGVIQAEAGAIDHYQAVIEATDGVDWATQDMVFEILADEQGHMRLFEGFLRELEVDGLA